MVHEEDEEDTKPVPVPDREEDDKEEAKETGVAEGAEEPTRRIDFGTLRFGKDYEIE